MPDPNLVSALDKIGCAKYAYKRITRNTKSLLREAQVNLRVKTVGAVLSLDDITRIVNFRKSIDSLIWSDNEKYAEIKANSYLGFYKGKKISWYDRYLVKKDRNTVNMLGEEFILARGFQKHSLGTLKIINGQAIPVFDLDFLLVRFDFYSCLSHTPLVPPKRGWFRNGYEKYARQNGEVIMHLKPSFRNKVGFPDGVEKVTYRILNKENLPQNWRLDYQVINRVSPELIEVEANINQRRLQAVQFLIEYANDKYDCGAVVPWKTTMTK